MKIQFITGNENLHIDETFVNGSTNAVESREIQRRFYGVEAKTSALLTRTGFIVLASEYDLPADPDERDKTAGFIINGDMYAYVGEGGDAGDGKYLNCGPFKGEKGDQGNTGSSIDYPFELVNNLETDDATKGLSASMGKRLDGKIAETDAELRKLDESKADKGDLELDDKVDFMALSTDEEQTSLGYGEGKFLYKSGTINAVSGNVAVVFPLDGMRKLKYRAYLSANNYAAISLKKELANNVKNVVHVVPNDATGWQEGEIDLSLFPTAKYAVFSTRTSSATYRDGSYCTLTNEGIGKKVTEIKENIVEIETNAKRLDQGLTLDNGIFAFNGKEKWKTRIAQLHREMSLTNGNKYQSLVLGWFTDVHECSENLPRYREFFDYFSTTNFTQGGDSKACLDDVIHTGDTVKDNLAEGIPVWAEHARPEWLNLAGNHEYYADSSKTTISSASAVRDILITPNEGVWNANGVVTVPGKNYWYKDYAEKRIRLISIDTGNWSGSFDTEQQSWLAARLDEARSLVDPNDSSKVGYTVILATHIAPKTKTLRSHPWCNLKSTANTLSEVFVGDETSINEKLVPIVSTFIDNGGKFGCYLAGHVHSDYIGFAADDPRQLVVIQAMSTLDKHRGVNDRRMEKSSSQDCINIVGMNVVTSTIVMARVGYREDKYLREIDSFCYNYATRQFVDLPATLSELGLKADKEDTYTKSDTDSAISAYHDATKADRSFVETELGKKADSSSVPTKVSQLTNDSGYLTQHQDISGKADKTYVDTELGKKQATISDLSSIRTGAGKGATALQPGDVKTVAKTGSYNDLTDKPTIPDVSGKADKSSVYTKSETYTKSESDALVENALASMMNEVVGGFVDEPVEGTFVSRPTADGASVRGFGFMDKVKGNTIKVVQLADETNNYIKSIGQGTAGAITSPRTLPLKSGHKYLVQVSDNGEGTIMEGSLRDQTTSYNPSWNVINGKRGSFIADFDKADTHTAFLRVTYTAEKMSDLIFSLFDLTAMGMADITTADEFAHRLGYGSIDELPYMAYTEGSVYPMTADKVVSRGRNLTKIIEDSTLTQAGVTWSAVGDHITASGVATGFTSFLSGKTKSVAFKDDLYISLVGTWENITLTVNLYLSDGSLFKAHATSTTRFFLAKSLYPQVSYISWSIKRDNNVATTVDGYVCVSNGAYMTAYAPYTENEFPLPISSIMHEGQPLFPNGLNGINGVRDEVDLANGKAVKRVGVVDLGSLDWAFNSAYDTSMSSLGISAVCKKAASSTDTSVLVVCGRYLCIGLGDRESYTDPRVFIDTMGSIVVRNPQTSDPSAFKASLHGSLLYYELATPVVVDFPPQKAYYKVEANGTEEIHAEGMTAPITANIGYNGTAEATALNLL